MTEEEKKYWLGFSSFPGIGPLRFKLLLKYFKSAKRAWNAKDTELLKIGLGQNLTKKFSDFKKSFSFTKYIEEIKRKEIHIITITDKEYPKLLKEISDAPFLLYVRGDIGMFHDKDRPCQGAVAVVGTRRITNYGREVTSRIVKGLKAAGVTIVSGMAYGVDAVAHEIAIETSGRTIAVLGCGVDVIYPAGNATIYWKIVKGGGLVISEYPIGFQADKWTFPLRNRIISGLSLGVVVIEGAEDSGALITAKYAAEQGREVFAVPGPITSAMSAAPTILLKQGAKMVTEASDILEELDIRNKPINQSTNNQINEKMGKLSNEERKIIELLGSESLHFDEMVRVTGIAAEKLGSILTVMEMKKIVKNLGGGAYGLFD